MSRGLASRPHLPAAPLQLLGARCQDVGDIQWPNPDRCAIEWPKIHSFRAETVTKRPLDEGGVRTRPLDVPRSPRHRDRAARGAPLATSSRPLVPSPIGVDPWRPHLLKWPPGVSIASSGAMVPLDPATSLIALHEAARGARKDPQRTRGLTAGLVDVGADAVRGRRRRGADERPGLDHSSVRIRPAGEAPARWPGAVRRRRRRARGAARSARTWWCPRRPGASSRRRRRSP